MSSAVPPETDTIDRRILGHLADDGRISIRALAEAVSLSSSATSERVRRLEQSGAITGYRAIVHPGIDGRGLNAIVGVSARPDADRSALEQWITSQPAVFNAVHLTGQTDYLLWLRCRDTAELDQLLMTMKSDADVTETETRIVLRTLTRDSPPSARIEPH